MSFTEEFPIRTRTLVLLASLASIWVSGCGSSGSGDASGGAPANAGSSGASAPGTAGSVNASGAGGASTMAGASAIGGANSAGAAGASGAPSSNGGSAGMGAAGAGAAGVSGSAGVNAGGGAGTAGAAGGATLPGYTLAWSDEFNAADGTAVDAAKWGHDVGGTGWGNSELEYYTTDTANAVQSGGNLVITATTAGATKYMCSGAPCKYTSARLLTKGLYSATYGRIEARIRMPTGKGIWPAFWMLGDNLSTVPWPGCGEVDIMETIGTDSTKNHGSMHGPGYSGGSPLTATYSLPGSPKLSDDFHVYAVEWAMDVVRFYVDGNLFETRTPSDVTGKQWVFNHPFFMILNLAVGGTWPGNPDTTTVFPVQMLVDYVRVYHPS